MVEAANELRESGTYGYWERARVGGNRRPRRLHRLTSPLLPPIASPFRLTIGLRRIEPAAWIEVDDAYSRDLIERERVLDAHFGEVVQRVDRPDARAACAELLDLLVDELPIDAGRVWRRREDGLDRGHPHRLVVRPGRPW